MSADPIIDVCFQDELDGKLAKIMGSVAVLLRIQRDRFPRNIRGNSEAVLLGYVVSQLIPEIHPSEDEVMSGPSFCTGAIGVVSEGESFMLTVRATCPDRALEMINQFFCKTGYCKVEKASLGYLVG